MLVVLDEGGGLVKILSLEVSLQVFNLLEDDWDAIFANDDTFHFNTANLCVPVVISDFSDLKPLLGIGIQNFLNQILVLR